MRRPVLLALFLLASCGGPTPEQQAATATTQSLEATTTAANTCREAAVSYGKEMDPIYQEWDDQLKLTEQTGRGQLAPQIQSLQAIKRKADAVTVPECAKVAHGHIVIGMNDTIDGFLAFMSQQPQTEVSAKIKSGSNHFNQYRLELDKATVAPTAAPVPTATP